MHTFLILSSADHSPWVVYTAGYSGQQAATGSAINTNNNGQSAVATTPPKGNSRSAHIDGHQGQQRLWRQRAAATGTILLGITNTIFKF